MPVLYLRETSLFYTVIGDGIPIVFIHPPLLTSANFMYQLEELSKQYKVISLDIRGHGQSGYSKETITYPLIVEDITHLLDYLGIEKAFICGYSTGGSIVLEYLLTNANRALGGIIISGMSEVKDLYLKGRISLAVNMAKEKAIPFLSLAITWGNSNNRHMFKMLYKEARNGFANNIQQYYRYSLEYNCTAKLHNIYLPVLLVYGKKDKSFHKYAFILHEKLPDNILLFLNDEKHQIPTKAAHKLNKVISEFINS
ncbi:alpha/beta hydrolase [Heyndrickxia oleronia]|uniref:alpha/beta fold hydrolase n=1 Tax=Heyndrickxia oleronia TaxID=38875 RepID=UPI00203F423E|nr:alpha/beta hydrolase [Heyndrickxia oleronia]MCM3238758.1 alpha/beta hydrolase [Heyndrickxia oleronia]